MFNYKNGERQSSSKNAMSVYKTNPDTNVENSAGPHWKEQHQAVKGREVPRQAEGGRVEVLGGLGVQLMSPEMQWDEEGHREVCRGDKSWGGGALWGRKMCRGRAQQVGLAYRCHEGHWATLPCWLLASGPPALLLVQRTTLPLQLCHGAGRPLGFLIGSTEAHSIFTV